jgi:hypothetical protein
MGARHAAAVLFLIYAFVAAVVLSITEGLTGQVHYNDWTTWGLQISVKGVAIFILGGFAFIAGYLLWP